MDSLDAVLKGTGAMLLLADRDGRVIRTVRDNARTSRMLLKRGVNEGASLAEDLVGNNGIGTALETRAGVFIHGEQHFAEVLRDFICYGHPIVDPLTGRLVGAVDLTGLSADASRMFAPFVRKIVAEIEAGYVDTARSDDRELWHRFVERTRATDTAACAFGDEVVLASHSSLERLASHDFVTLRRMVERDELGDAVELSVGTVGVLSSRVGRRGHLLDLTFPEQERTSGENRRTAARRESLARGAEVAVSAHSVEGPAGSGRSTEARVIAGPDARHVRLADADSADAAWRDLVVPALRDQHAPLILDDIDLLGDADLRRLAARLRSAGAGLVVVTSRDNSRAAVLEVLDACGARTVLRPLHERGEETGEIVRRMVADLAAERGVSEPAVGARFVDTVCSVGLPNGLVSLRSILGECLTECVQKASTTLDVDSLPSRARSARPPRSGELARGEYDMIVAALAECDGVRSRTARRLGISRTTLYARMREFGLS